MVCELAMVDDDQREAMRLVETLVRQTGLSVTEVARRAGVAPSTLTRIYPVPSVKYTLSARTLSKLRQLEMNSTDRGQMPRAAPVVLSSSSIVSDLPRRLQASGDEVVGLYWLTQAVPPADGPFGSLKLAILAGDLAKPIEKIISPLARGGDEFRYFLTYMPDDSMAPRFRSGDYLLIDRFKPSSVGGEVLIVFEERLTAPDTFALIAQIVMRNRSEIKLKQYVEDVIDTISQDDIAHIYSIVGTFDAIVRC